MCGWNVNICLKRYVEFMIVLEKFNEKFQYLKLNKWELLAAMQALSIYLLIRLDEGETDHNNIDSLLLAAVIVGLDSAGFVLPWL
jgi:hypothetical protein